MSVPSVPAENIPPAPPPPPPGGVPEGPDWNKIVTWSIRVLGLVFLLGLVYLFFIDFMIPRGSSDEAKGSEARAALGAMKDRARVVYGKNKVAPQSVTELGMGATELNGSYYTNAHYSCGGDAKKWWAKCRDVYKSPPHDLIVTVDLETGNHDFNR